MNTHFRKATHVDADGFDGDLILMNLQTRQVLVLNETANILWTAIDLVDSRNGLLDLLREAMPGKDMPQLESSLDGVLKAWLAGGFLEARPSNSA